LIPKYELPEKDQKVYEQAMGLEKNEKGVQKLESSEWYLRYLSFKGMNWRFGYTFSQEEMFELTKKCEQP
jgi:ribosome-binding factor A